MFITVIPARCHGAPSCGYRRVCGPRLEPTNHIDQCWVDAAKAARKGGGTLLAGRCVNMYTVSALVLLNHGTGKYITHAFACRSNRIFMLYFKSIRHLYCAYCMLEHVCCRLADNFACSVSKRVVYVERERWVFVVVVSVRMATAEVNGSSAPAREEDEPMDVSSTHTEHYQTLLDAGLPQKVAESLDNIFQTGGVYCYCCVSTPLQSHLPFRSWP